MFNRSTFSSALLCFFFLPACFAQSPVPVPPKGTTPSTTTPQTASIQPSDYSSESFVIQKYATDVTYAEDGTGERLITVQVKVQSDAAVRQFGVLEFPYESRNEHVDFVYVRVRKPDGSVVATPETDAQDQAAEVTRQAPFYSDLHNKQIPVKSLSVGDQLEYQVRQVRTVASAPGQFWYTQQFVTNAVVLEETASLSVPRKKYVQVESPKVKPEITETGDRRIYRWKTAQLEKSKPTEERPQKPVIVEEPPSIAVTTFKDWAEVGRWYGDLQKDRVSVTPTIQAKADELVKSLPAGAAGDQEKIAAIYGYVATQYRYIGVAFGIGRYQPHSADDVMQNQYGDCKDKHTLLATLLKAEGYDAWPVLVGSQHVLQPNVPSPGQFDHVITAVTLNKLVLWMDSTPEVAPFQMLYSGLRDKLVLAIPNGATPVLMKTPPNPPFASFNKLDAKGSLSAQGTLTAHFDLSLRGDEELVYRVAFHNTPRMQWQTLAQNVSYATGFAGTISNVDAGLPEKTAEPFRYSYDYSRKEFADWANRRILPLMPPILFAYGEDDAKPADTILLSGPVTYSFHTIIQLPDGYTADLPSPVKQQTDFATYTATYTLDKNSLIVDRNLELKQREIPVAGWDDYIKLEKAVVADEGTYIQLIGSGMKKPESPAQNNPEAAELVQQAFTDIRTKNYDEAKKKLDKAKELNDAQYGVWAGYGYINMWQGHDEEGISEYKQELKNHPENLDAYRTMAWMQMRVKHQADAAETVRALLKASPTDAPAHKQLASMLIGKKNWAEAVPLLQEAIKLSPDDAYLKVMLGNAQLSSGAKDEGAMTLRALLNSTTDENILNDASYELADANLELPLARASCEKALRQLDELTSKITLSTITEDDLQHIVHLAATWDTMAWILYRQRDFSGAEEYAIAAWSLNPRPESGLHLGAIYQAQHRKDETVHLYRLAVVSGNGEGTGVEEAQSRLKALGLPAMAHDDAQLRQELMDGSKVKFAAPDYPKGMATVYVLLSPGSKVDGIQVTDGSDALKSVASLLPQAQFNVPFPMNSGARILRRGQLTCSDVLKECMFAIAFPEYTHKTP